MSLRIVFDEHLKMYKAKTSEGLYSLEGFLSSDMQTSLAAINFVLGAIKDIEEGKISEWDFSGNAYYLNLDKAMATISDQLLEDEDICKEDKKTLPPPDKITIARLKEALIQWRDTVHPT